MKNYIILLFLCCFFFGNATAQQKYSTKTGTIVFEASVPSFEEVKAMHENVSAILNMETGQFASLALIKGFRFKVALMEEHFNENYMESSEFPKAIVKGTLQEFTAEKISEAFQSFTLKGTITMHGVTQDLETQIRLKKDTSGYQMETEFILKPESFNIEIPKIVSSKIANEVTVMAIYSLSN